MSINCTDELRREVERAGDDPVRLVHPATQEQFVVLRAEVYDRLHRLLQAERVDPSFFEFEEKDSPE
jgi:hypothetical protein